MTATKRRAPRPLPARHWPKHPPVRIVGRELVFSPWVARLRASLGDSDLWHAVYHLAFDRVDVEDYPVDRRKLAALDERIDAAVRDVLAGRLRGARAAKRIEAISARLSALEEATERPCPTCGTMLHPEKYAELRPTIRSARAPLDARGGFIDATGRVNKSGRIEQ